MKFLIFGATGLVGKNLISLLQMRHEDFLGISKSGRDGSLALDITKDAEFEKIKFNPDVIVNCASQTPLAGKSSKDPDFLEKLFKTNVIGGANIANWAVKNKIPKIFNCSTLSVVNKPWPVPITESSKNTPSGTHAGYCMSKLSQEVIMNECVRSTITQVLHLRISAVYGPEMKEEGIIFNLIKNFRSNRDVILTDGEKNFVDFINVNDISRTLYELAKRDINENILNLASGEEISILELANLLKSYVNSTSEIKDVETDKFSSRANVELTNLKLYMNTKYDEFIPFKEGLKTILK